MRKVDGSARTEETHRLFMRLLDGQRIVVRLFARAMGCEITGYAGHEAFVATVRDFGGDPNGIHTL